MVMREEAHLIGIGSACSGCNVVRVWSCVLGGYNALLDVYMLAS